MKCSLFFKQLSALIALVLTLTAVGLPASATSYIQTHVSIIAGDDVLADSDQFISDDGCTITDATGTDHIITGALAICAFDQAADMAGVIYSADYYADYNSLFISTIGDTATASDYSQSWMFYLNGQMAMTGADSTTVADGDVITFAYGTYGASTPLQLTLSKRQLLTGKQLIATVEYVDDSGVVTPASGATVQAGQQTLITDDQGQAVIQFRKPGTKHVTALADGYTRTVSQAVIVFPKHARGSVMKPAARSRMIKQATSYLQHDAQSGVSATSQSLTDWTVMALGATPLDTPRLSQRVAEFDATAETIVATDIARNTLAAAAAGQTKRARLLADLLVTAQESCSDGYINDEIYSVLAWSAVAAKNYPRSIETNVNCVMEAVTADGGVALTPGGEADIDTTAAFVQMAASLDRPARVGLDRATLRQAQRRAAAFLKHAQNLDGGWGYAPDMTSNASSTATALMALTAAGSQPARVRTNHRNGFQYLKSVQKKSGAFAYDTYGTSSIESLNTAYAVMALQHVALPVNQYIQ